MHPVLRLYEDVLSTTETIAFRLPPLPRFIFVVHGSAAIAGGMVKAGEAWQGDRARSRSSRDPTASPAGAGSSRAAMPAQRSPARPA